MALLNQSVQVYGPIPKFLEKLRAGQAPEKFTREFLKDLGFKSSNHLAFIPLLKGLGFLTSDAIPTPRYRNFLDQTRWREVLAEAVKEAYGDIFVIKSKPVKSDINMIAGKYKSTYNMSDVSAERAARTFLALLDLADQDTLYSADVVRESTTHAPQPQAPPEPPAAALPPDVCRVSLQHTNSSSCDQRRRGIQRYLQIFAGSPH